MMQRSAVVYIREVTCLTILAIAWSGRIHAGTLNTFMHTGGWPGRAICKCEESRSRNKVVDSKDRHHDQHVVALTHI